VSIESQTDSLLTFAPRARAKRIRSLIGGTCLVLIGVLTAVVFGLAFASPKLFGVTRSEGTDISWLSPVAVALTFPALGLAHLFSALPLRLEIQRQPAAAWLRWRTLRFRVTECPEPDAILVGVRRGQRRARYFALLFRSKTINKQFFRSFDYWWSDRQATDHAAAVAKVIADFLKCPLESEGR
jgi:hypothetical protein